MRINPDSSNDFPLVAHQVVEMTTRELARRKLAEFTLYTKPDYDMQDFHRVICETLDLVLSRQLLRLMLSMPPRHGKSELTSIRLPALELGQRPHSHIIHASHSTSLSNSFSFQVRDLIRGLPAFRRLFPDVQLHPDRQRLDNWLTTSGGGMFSVGVASAISGHGADLLIIDDPIKEGDEQSLTTLQQIYDWFVSAAMTRLSPGAPVLITGTRWSPLDLIGRLTALMKSDPKADQYYVLVLPGIAGENDMLGREVGAALWPARFGLERLRALKLASERYFLALIQQDPRATDTQLFFPEYFKEVTEDFTTGDRAAWCFDLAITEKDSSDYTAFARYRYNKKTGILYISGIMRVRKEWPKVKRLIKRMAAVYPDDDFCFSTHMLELMAVQELRGEMPEATGRIIAVDQPGDKRARASVLADRGASGRVYVRRSRHSQAFINEHLNFPADMHDDWVDSGSVATHHFGINSEVKALILQNKDEKFVDQFERDLSALRQDIFR